MNGDRFERLVGEVLSQDMPSAAPEELLDSILTTTGRARPRPRWLASLKEPPMHYQATIAVGSPPARRVSLLALAALAAATLVGAAIAGSVLVNRPTVEPRPATVAPPPGHNGLIAYDTDGTLMIADADGSHPRLFLDKENQLSSPTWSPDGTRLAFWEETTDGKHLHAVDADTRNDTDLTKDGGLEPLEYGNGQIAWSPDGQLIATSVNPVPSAVLIVHTDGTGFDRLPVAVDAAFPVWSPDGKQLAFQGSDASGPGLFVADLNGQGLKKLWSPAVLAPAVGIGPYELEPQWSPDGSAIVLYCCGHLEVVPVDGSEAGTMSDLFRADYWPTWSHDGKWIAFQRSVGHPKYELRIARPDGSDEHAVTQTPTGAGGPLVWAPDDSAILAFTPAFDGLFVAGLDGSVSPTIPMSHNIGHPSWQAVP